ncbi:MAG: vWA domain-containing protein [Dehalococcoidia bacterium]
MVNRFADLAGLVDVAFVVDTTGSMGPFIEAARDNIRRVAEEVADLGDLDLHFAVVEYRDHPPQELSFVTRVYPFDDGDALQAVLNGLQPEGGGDAPEAVLDGLVAAANLAWRANADRLCFLVGDAPPHGYGQRVSPPSGRRSSRDSSSDDDAWPEGCPCRATPNGVVELLRGHNIRLHAISLTADSSQVAAFRELAEGAGGSLTEAPSDPLYAATSTGEALDRTSALVRASRSYLAAAAETGSSDSERIATHLGWTEEMTEGTAAYLRERGIMPDTGDRA